MIQTSYSFESSYLNKIAIVLASDSVIIVYLMKQQWQVASAALEMSIACPLRTLGIILQDFLLKSR
jgi:hypothetical protein